MSFRLDLAKFAEKTGQRLDHVRRVVVIKLFSAVILDTPVDTGRLRGNWQTNIGSPATGTLDVTDPTGARAINEVNAKAEKMKADDDIYFTNNLPYANRIEYEGWSKKAPEGMVRKNVIRFKRLMDEAVRS